MKFQIDWFKLKKFFLWLIDWSEWLSPPVKCKIIKSNEKSLIGIGYYFFGLKDWRIKSPLKGVISKIYPNYVAIQITNNQGLQVLVDIQVDEKNPMPIDKIMHCEVKEGEKIDKKTILFSVYLLDYIKHVSVYVPWQPELLNKVGKLEKNDKHCFAKIYYRNPYTKLRFKKHGKY